MTASGVHRAFNVRTFRLCTGGILLLAALTLLGWAFGDLALAGLHSKYIPMAPTDALCFAGVALGMSLATGKLNWVSRLLTAAVLVVAGGKILESTVGVHLGIDETFVRDAGNLGNVPIGRMSPITAMTFAFVSVGVLYLSRESLRNRAGVPAVLTGLVSAVVLLGYFYGTPVLYGGGIIPVAATSALAFLLCSFALLIAAGPTAWPTSAFSSNTTSALLLRYFLPVLAGAILISGFIHARILHHRIYNPAVSSAVSAIFITFVVGWIITRVATLIGGRIDSAEKGRNKAQAELISLNSRLEELVINRTRELADKNAVMHEELEMARELQLALLPQKFPTIPENAAAKDSAVRFLSYYFPTNNVSGDFFCVFPVKEKAVGIFICDVMGHGVRAALVTAMIRALVEEHAHNSLEPGALVSRINRGLVAILEQAGATMYATGAYLVVDIERGELSYANAGHPRPLVISHNGSRADALPTDGISGPALGIFANATYGTGRRPINPGDLIMMFTDGLFEVENAEGEMFNEHELLATVRQKMALPTSKHVLDEVLGEVRRFSCRNEFDDDVCLVGVEVHDLNGNGTANMD